jgi:6-phosphofructokinase
MPKAEHKVVRDVIQHAKSYTDVVDLAEGEEGMTRSAEELAVIERLLEEGEARYIRDEPGTDFGNVRRRRTARDPSGRQPGGCGAR